MSDFLLELGLEEIPARMIAAAQAELLKRTVALLTREQLIAVDHVAKSYSTPRRLAVLIENVRTQQGDITEETTGPAVKIAFKDGIPTPAAEAFARKCDVAVSDLKTISTPKGDYLAATTLKRGRTAAEVIAAELPKEIAALYWAKNMRWIPSSNEKFVRPVLWIACLLGDDIVPLTFAGKTAGRATCGHRVLSNGDPFEIVTPASYLAQLEGEYVLADVELRRQKIRKALDKVTREIPNARWREDEALVDAVTHLTEWPDVLLGNFEPAYLALPEEVLVTVMRDHQKYFAVEIANHPGAPHLDSEMWETKNPLAPHFLTVTNIALDEINTPIIRQGNERVLRARFNDARFFWDFDQRLPLLERVKLLENVTFQKDLGSYAKKSKANEDMATTLAPFVGADVEVVRDAARLAKTDLTTELVKEFTELQGVIGGLYAKQQGWGDAVADAIYNQYVPAAATDPIPSFPEAQVLGLADRFTTILQMFSLGLHPTGSKDPFALRRAGNGVVKILAESELPLTLFHLFTAVEDSAFGDERTWQFFNDRIEFYLRDVRSFSLGVVSGVMSAYAAFVRMQDPSKQSVLVLSPNGTVFTNDVRDAVLRAEAVTEMLGSPDFEAVCQSFKQIKGMLSKAKQEQQSIPDYVRPDLLLEDVEKQFYEATMATAQQVERYRSRRTKEGYVLALREIANLRPQVAAFFDRETGVMVMTPEQETRGNRLALLDKTFKDFSRIADFSEIVTAG